jgi:methanesulfonate monooxygenase small subunit
MTTTLTKTPALHIAGEYIERARDLVYEANIALDDQRYADWLNLADTDFAYRVTSYSPEIRRDITWLEHDHNGMKNLIDLLPLHQSLHARLTRHAIVYRVTQGQSADLYTVTSSVVVYQTHLDGGETKLFAVGKYHDTVRVTPDGAKFASREVRLETRELGLGTHFPL